MGDMDIILSLNEYSIYKNDNYYLCIPNEDMNFYHVFMGFSTLELPTLSREELLMEIRKISDSIYAVYKNSVYVLPVIKTSVLEEATLENDDRAYNNVLQNYIQPITLSLYSYLVSKNKRVSQIIKLIKQNDMDKKLVAWISLKLGNDFVKEITFENNEQIPQENTDDIKSQDIISSISIDYQDEEIWVQQEEDKIMDSLKPATSPGFGNLQFMLMVLTISSVFGAIIAYLIIK